MKNKTKTIKEQERKQIDTITEQNEKIAALTNKDAHEDNCKEMFEEPVIERFDEIKELTDEINHDDLVYYFTANTARKKTDDVNNDIELFRKIQSGEMNLEEAKNYRILLK